MGNASKTFGPTVFDRFIKIIQSTIDAVLISGHSAALRSKNNDGFFPPYFRKSLVNVASI